MINIEDTYQISEKMKTFSFLFSHDLLQNKAKMDKCLKDFLRLLDILKYSITLFLDTLLLYS